MQQSALFVFLCVRRAARQSSALQEWLGVRNGVVVRRGGLLEHDVSSMEIDIMLLDERFWCRAPAKEAPHKPTQAHAAPACGSQYDAMARTGLPRALRGATK